MKRWYPTSSVISGVMFLSFGIGVTTGLTAAEPMMNDAQMMNQCTKLQAHRQHIAEDLKAEDEELAARVVQLNAAPADTKITELSVIVTRLVAQRTVTHARQSQIEQEMMQHLLHHLQMGKSSLAACPLLKSTMDLKGIDAPAVDSPTIAK